MLAELVVDPRQAPDGLLVEKQSSREVAILVDLRLSLSSFGERCSDNARVARQIGDFLIESRRGIDAGPGRGVCPGWLDVFDEARLLL